MHVDTAMVARNVTIVLMCAASVGLEVISTETVPVRMYSGNQYGNHEVTYTWNRGEQKEFWLLVIRIYFSGVEINVDMLPSADKPAVSDGEDHRKPSVDSGRMACCRLL